MDMMNSIKRILNMDNYLWNVVKFLPTFLHNRHPCSQAFDHLESNFALAVLTTSHEIQSHIYFFSSTNHTHEDCRLAKENNYYKIGKKSVIIIK